ncbi:alpha-glycosidase [Niallia sp. 01092]|uniref:alpha-glycosidase n=1 Tax=Niallia sp. 01092 TaxID=3457759 RepID=UPI003FCFA417
MIDLTSIYHRAADNYCYLFDEETLHIRIRTKRDNVLEIVLLYGDQYEIVDHQWITSLQPLEKIGSDSLFDYWQVAIKAEHKRIRYGFILKNTEQEMTLTEKGFFSFIPEDSGFFFCFPYMHKSDVFSSPDWVQQTIWYQIFPERFRNGDPLLNPAHTVEWGQEEPSLTNFFGGDFQGIIDSLDYLQDLGINGIYLTPIFLANSNHKYDTIDYFTIDPQFGNINLLKKLVEECHNRGIRVMLDAVFNHCSVEFLPFQDVLDKGEKSLYKDWFHIHKFPLKDGDTINYETFGFYEYMPKLNTANEEVKQYLLKAAAYWIAECQIDGWRLDVANEIDHQFWRDFRTTVKAIKPDLFILGEVWHDSVSWLRGDQFDSVMNYPFLHKSLQFFSYDIISAHQFTEDLTTILHSYSDNINQVLFNILGSHDTPRVLNECRFRKERVRLLFTFLFTFPGTPCIYYGDEIGLDGGNDPGCRKCMPWQEEQQDLELKDYIKTLISIRKETSLLTSKGTLYFLPAVNNCLAYYKQKDNQVVFVLINNSDTEIDYVLPFSLSGKKINLLLTQQEYAAESDELSVTLAPYESNILSFYI